MNKKPKEPVRRCAYRKCRKPLAKDKRAHAIFCDNPCRKSERVAVLAEKQRCRACGKKLSKRSKVYCDDHLDKAKAYKRKSDTKK